MYTGVLGKLKIYNVRGSVKWRKYGKPQPLFHGLIPKMRGLNNQEPFESILSDIVQFWPTWITYLMIYLLIYEYLLDLILLFLI